MSTPTAGVGTRSVAADNKAYIKIDAIGDGTDAASALGEKSIAIGSNASARPSSTGLGGAVAVGGNAAATANNVAVGASASANGEQGAIAVGALASASGKSSIAVGNEAKAAGWGAYAMGRKAQATAESSLALGDSTVASAVGAVAHGLQASATAENAVALGMSASALGADSVALGSYSESDRDQTVSVGTAGFERQIVNVGRGTLDTDAANISQLKGVTDALGGGAGIGTDGSVKAPVYTVDGKQYGNVGDALAAAAASGGGAGGNAVVYDGETKDKVTLAGGKTGTTLSNVKAGTLDTDAVNVSQLKSSGLVGEDGKSLSAVVYDGATKDKVTLAGGTTGTTITNVKPATLTSTSKDAVNGAQLFATNASLGALEESLKSGGAIDETTGESLAVVYDGTTKAKVTLAGGKTGTTLSNVKAGTLDMDAVNVSQLKSSGLIGEDGKSLSAVAYDKKDDGSTNFASVTLGGVGAKVPTALHNVAKGVATTDAVNVSQLKGVTDALGGGAGIGEDGSVTKPSYKVGDKTYNDVGAALQAANAGGNAGNAVQYDSDTKKTVTLGGTASTSPVSLKNLAQGVADTDAVNVQQLSKGLNDIKDEISSGLSDGTLPMKYIQVKASGMKANALGANSVAIGGNANATVDNAVAIGSGARARAFNSVALGINSVADQENTVSIGDTGSITRRIVNVSDGIDENDAVNMKQLADAIGALDTKTQRSVGKRMMQRNVESTPGSFVAVDGIGKDGDYPSVASLNGATSGTAMAAGVSSVAAGRDALAVGVQAVAGSDNSVALGSGAQTGADQPYAVAVGSGVTTNGAETVAVGSNAKANANRAVALGNNRVWALGQSSVAIGDGAKAQAGAVNGIAVGTGASVAVNIVDAMALGAGASATAAGGVALGSGAVANRGNALSVGSGTVQRQIINVAKGTASTDAVNVSQLKGVTDALGGGAAIGTDGSVKAPVYTVDGKEYANVGDALEAAAASGGGTSENAVVYDGATKDKVTLAGKTGTTLSNVKAGTLDTDAVNVSQLKSSGLIGEDGKSLSAVVYDGATKDKVTLAGGKTGTTLSNVKAGTLDMDAVNVSQLKSSGLIGEDGKSLSAVVYDKKDDGSTNFASVTLGGAGAKVPTVLHNVAKGVATTDAVNVSQLKGVTDALGGGAAIGTDGSVKAPVYTVDGKEYANVGDALEAAAASGGGTSENAVVYDGTTKDKVTLAGKTGTTLSNVKAGSLDTDAVNVSQLKSSGLIGEDGKSLSAVVYDGATKDKVTLAGGKTGTTITNVKAGALSSTSNDAVNGAQLFATNESLGALNESLKDGGVIDGTTGESLAVVYDGTTKDKVTLAGGKTGTTLSNVKAGTLDMDAVNVSQLKSSGLIGDDGKSLSAVVYDKKDDGSTNFASVTLGGAGAKVPTALHNVAKGVATTDAVNVSQLKGVTDALGGGAAIGTDGSVKAPVYTVDGKEYANVGDALEAAAASGGGTSENAVVYDGTTKDKVTLAGKTGTTLSNVKAGSLDTDAVNVSQLKSSGLIGEDGKSLSAVVYDGATKDKVTLAGGTTGTTITNVKAGALTSTSKDAVNGAQLFATNESLGALEESLKDGGVIDGTTGESLAVVYDGTTKDKVTLAGGKTGTTLSNVKAGTLDMDAVNVSQLKSSGLIGEDGKSLSAVVYDGTTKDKVTLAGGKTGTTLSNVKAGTLDMDAVNVSQLKSSGLIGEDGKSLSAVVYDKKDDGSTNFASVTLGGAGAKVPTVLHNVAKGVATTDAVNVSQLKGVTDALGGGAAIGTDGSVKAPVYTIDGKEYANVGDALEAAAASGGGTSENAVVYDGTTKDKVTLAGGKTGTTITNVKAGALSSTSNDAVNGAQLFATNESLGALNESLKDGGVIDGTTGESLAVVYDGTTKDKVTLAGGKTGTTLSNVKAGTLDMDAVNVSQLKSSGLIGEDGKSLSAVVYDGTTKDKVTLAGGKTGTTLSNVKAGTLDMDAVNVSQLKSSGLIGEDGKSLSAVVYDSATKDKVTLAGGKTGTTLSNVKAGTLDMDAVNVSQLKSSGLIGEDGKSLSAVVYDGTTKDKVTLAGGKTGTTLSNVKAGTLDMDAVNVSQLKSSGLIGEDGKSLSAVVYDKKDDGSTNFASVTLGGAGAKVPTVLHNVAKGVASTDAVNVSQLKGVTDALGGGAGIGTDGSVKAPVYTVDGKEYANVGDALEAAAASGGGTSENAVVYDGTTKDKVTLAGGKTGTIITNVKAGALSSTSNDAVNGAQLFATNESLGALEESLKDGGVIDGTTGESLAVVYDGTTKDKVTLAGGKTGTTLSNVKAGTLDMDAVNMSQLKSSGLIGEDGKSLSAVVYDGTTKDKVTLAGGKTGTTLSNVKAGTLDMDAVNVSQMKSSGLIGEDGKSLSAVVYDGATKDKVTLAGGTTGTTITNVKAGALTSTSKDAVNGAQLFATNESLGALEESLKDGGVIDGTTGESLAVVYDGTTKDKVTLAGGKTGTTLSNVKAGTLDMDAVNVSQLKSSGLIGEDGKSLSAVVYDKKDDGSTNFASVTLGGAGAKVPTVLHNIAKGVASTDAVNVSQLKGVTDALGGGAAIGTDGSVKAPVYTVDGKEYANVGDALEAAAASGGGTSENAVVYDGATKDKVTLAGKAGTLINNVANGSLTADSSDAVNGAQLNAVATSVSEHFGAGAALDTATGKITAPSYTLAGANGGTETYHNVGDALENLDGRTSENTNQIDSLQRSLANAVHYDDETHAEVTFGGKGAAAPVTLKNVADGADDTDAVNVRQLKSAGLIGGDGTLLAAVTYDKHDDGTTNYSSVTLGGTDATAPVTLHNVAKGVASTDAVNVSQLTGVTTALGGGAKLDPQTGEIVAPTYEVGGNTYHNVGDAFTDIDNRVTNIQNNLGESVNLAGVVAYDKHPDGTPNFGSVTLGNGVVSGPVTLTNVADGKSQYDAVNYGQLSALQGQVDEIHDRVIAAEVPGGSGGAVGNGLIDGTGGKGDTAGDVVAPKPGTGNANVSAGSNSQVANGVNDGTAVGANASVKSNGGTAIGQGATVSAGASNAVAIGQGSVANEANTVSIGSDGHTRRLVNVADGVKATDAVSKGQFDRAIGGMQGQIDGMARNAYSGVAAATALTMIPGVDPGKNLSFGIGAASYKGYQAVAMGGEARITENLKMKAGVSLSSGGNVVGAGASYQW
ncbi:YadA-like family protein [Burkholderia latens]|uniref:YadA-like family protein n=1 Tax=Burkholderia latens TaxID=488446 RepID=UPI0028F40DE3|nr:YadA-like family protein [Burkholderia latens]